MLNNWAGKHTFIRTYKCQFQKSFNLLRHFNIPVSIALATLAHIINVYNICLNTTNYPIFNMQDFRYCMWTSISDCFGQLVSPQCDRNTQKSWLV